MTDRIGASGLLASWEDRPAAEWALRLGLAAAEFHSTIGSMSDRARRLAEAGGALPALVVADRQERGRGRRGRRWVSGSDRGLWCTLALDADAGGADVLPLRAGLAVARALESLAPAAAVGVKWPNDLVIGGRKVGGILCERSLAAVLVGVGVNLNHRRAELPAVEPPATSLSLECGHAVPRGEALAAVVGALRKVWAHPSTGIPPAELDALNARSALNGRPLSVSGVVRDSTCGPQTVEDMAARGLRLLPDGSLEVRDRAGGRWRVIAGTVNAWS